MDLGYFSNKIFDPATNTLVGTSPMPLGNTGAGTVAVNSANTKIYTANNNNVNVLDIASGAVSTLSVNTSGWSIRSLCLSPDDAYLFTGNTSGSSNDIKKVTLSTGSIATIFSLSTYQILGLAVSPDGTKLYAACGDGNLRILASADGSVLNTVSVGGVPGQIKVLPDDSKLYVANSNTSKVNAVDIGALTSTDISLNNNIGGLAMNSDGSHIYTCGYYSGNGELYDIDTSTDTLTTTSFSGYSFDFDYMAVALDDSAFYCFGTHGNRYMFAINLGTLAISQFFYNPFTTPIVFVGSSVAPSIKTGIVLASFL